MPMLIGESSDNDGVLGVTHAPGKSGVAGVNDETVGASVMGRCKMNNGVQGFSEATNGAAGVVGVNELGNGPGVEGRSSKNDGVLGRTTGDGKAGVTGVCDAGNGNGVFGRSVAQNGVVGQSSADFHAGVAGVNTSLSANAGPGVFGKGSRLAGQFEGNVDISGNLTVQGVNIGTLGPVRE